MQIREAKPSDWDAIWPFLNRIVAAGDTFTYPADTDEKQAHDGWLLAAPDRTVVAVDETRTVLGTAKMNQNHMGNASHIASASYMVDPAHTGRGGVVPCASTHWNGLACRGTGPCSSTRSWRPTPAR